MLIPTHVTGQASLFLLVPSQHHHIPAPSSLRMFILHFTEEHWTLGTAPPPSILSGIIAWTITTDTYCEVIRLKFKGLVLGEPNEKGSRSLTARLRTLWPYLIWTLLLLYFKQHVDVPVDLVIQWCKHRAGDIEALTLVFSLQFILPEEIFTIDSDKSCSVNWTVFFFK